MPRKIPYQKKNKCKNCDKLLKLKPRPNYISMSKSYRSKQRTFLLKKLQQLASYASTISLSLLPVKFANNSALARTFGKKDMKIIKENDQTETAEFKHAKGRDEALISYKKYQRFNNTAGLSLSSEYRIRKVYKRIDDKFRLLNNAFGYFFDTETKIKFVLKKTLQKMRANNIIVDDDSFILKFCGDGTNITKSRLQIINLAFTVINDSTTAMSAKGNYILGVFQVKQEDYEQIRSCLTQLLNDIKNINEVELDGKMFKIKKCIGGDLKFLATLYGINAANSDHPCIWCKVNITEEINFNNLEQWSLSDRSLSESQKFLGNKEQKQHKGYTKQPIVDFIDFNLVIVDMLHLYLRITDKFFEILIAKLDEKDRLALSSKKLIKRQCFNRFVNFLENQCKINKPFYPCEKEKHKYKLRSLNSNERAICFKKLTDVTIKILFPELENETATNLNYVFANFMDTINSIKRNEYNATNIIILKDNLFKWLSCYVKLMPSIKRQITPYIHCYVFHMPEFIVNFREINLYNLQGLEKLNDFSTQIYHSATNKHKINKCFIIQMIRKRNRMEFYDLKGNETEINQ